MSNLFVSCATYELGKRLGIAGAAREFARQCQQPQRGDLPAARFVARLRQWSNVELFHGAGSCLPKLRSRAAFAAHRSEADYWVMIDDDVECDTATANRLLLAAGAPQTERITVLPCLMRGVGAELSTVNVSFSGSLSIIYDGIPVRPVVRAGTGCMVVTRAALARLMREHVNDDWKDDDGERKPALFEMIREPGGPWWGEDFSFCKRALDARIPIVAPVEGTSFHDGHVLDLRSLE